MEENKQSSKPLTLRALSKPGMLARYEVLSPSGRVLGETRESIAVEVAHIAGAAYAMGVADERRRRRRSRSKRSAALAAATLGEGKR